MAPQGRGVWRTGGRQGKSDPSRGTGCDRCVDGLGDRDALPDCADGGPWRPAPSDGGPGDGSVPSSRRGRGRTPDRSRRDRGTSDRSSCLRRVVPLGEAHVRQLVHEFVEHDHHERNHQGRDNQLLQRPPPPVNPDADVERRERLGGLLSFYYREAARGGGSLSAPYAQEAAARAPLDHNSVGVGRLPRTSGRFSYSRRRSGHGCGFCAPTVPSLTPRRVAKSTFRLSGSGPA